MGNEELQDGDGSGLRPGIEPGPNPSQANRLYLAALFFMLVGSVLLVPRIGLGLNLWVNELVFFLMPVALLAGRKRWRWRDVYAFRPAPAKAIVAATLGGIGFWVFNAVLAMSIESSLTRYIGQSVIPEGMIKGLSSAQVMAFIFGLVVLAPFCEEVFFRGMMQNAYSRFGEKQALIATSVLFGFYHALNGVSNVIPATLIGFALGYCALKTGSIWPGIALHAANNGLASLTVIADTGKISSSRLLAVLNWPTAIVGLALALLMMGIIKSCSAPRQKPDTAERLPPSAIWRSVSLWISISILCLVCVVEISSRARVGPFSSVIPAAQAPQTMSMSAGKISGKIYIAVIEVPEPTSESADCSEIGLEFSFSAGPSDFTLTLVAPDGSVAWSDEYSTAETIEVDTPYISVPAEMPGEWQIIMDGTTTELTFSAKWGVFPPDSGEKE